MFVPEYAEYHNASRHPIAFFTHGLLCGISVWQSKKSNDSFFTFCIKIGRLVNGNFYISVNPEWVYTIICVQRSGCYLLIANSRATAKQEAAKYNWLKDRRHIMKLQSCFDYPNTELIVVFLSIFNITNKQLLVCNWRHS